MTVIRMGFYEVARETNRFIEVGDNLSDLHTQIDYHVLGHKSNGNSVKATIGLSEIKPEEYTFSVNGFTKNYTNNIVKAFDKKHRNRDRIEMEFPELFSRYNLEKNVKDVQKRVSEENGFKECLSLSLNFVRDKKKKMIEFCSPQMDVKKDNFLASFRINGVKNEEKEIDLLACYAKPANGGLDKIYNSLKEYRIGSAGIKKMLPLSEILNQKYEERKRKDI